MEYTTELAADIQTIWELIRHVKVAMLVTVEHGKVRSRPMLTQEQEFDGKLWFFTSACSEKASESENKHRVNVIYCDTDRERFVSMSGDVCSSHDHQLMTEHWNASYSAWFPLGLNDPELTLLKIDVDSAEYWTAPPSTVTKLFVAAKATLTGKPDPIVVHDQITLI